MLVLSRKIGEQIVIDGDVQVTVLAINGHTVRLGIAAPPSISVDRSEVFERRQLAGCTGPLLPVTAL